MKTVVGLGEVLWDILDNEQHLGGAPANFAYITRLMGDEGIIASRVGADALGESAKDRLQALGLSTDFIQIDGVHPTGSVRVKLDGKGCARFEILAPVAWDFLEWTPEWQKLAETADAVCFGSLAQRTQQSRDVILRFLRALRPKAVRIFDVNLRPPFYSQGILVESMKLADIVKLNHEELPHIMSMGGHVHRDERTSAQSLITLYGLKLVCVTRGSRGSLLVSQSGSHEQPAFEIKVADTVGAGDAFTAALVHEYLRGGSLDAMNGSANLVGAWVASEVGATPTPKNGALKQSLREIG